MPIKHVSFDLWRTLIRSHPEFKRSRAELVRDWFEVPCSVDDVLAEMRRYDVATTRINEIVGGNIDCFETILFVLGRLDIDLSKLSAMQLDEFYREMEQRFQRFAPQPIEHNLAESLAWLQQNDVSLSILSNTGFIRGSTLRQMIATFGWEPHFDFQIYSDEIGCSKPNAGAFEAVMDSVQKIKHCEKSEVLHIGDNPVADVSGATAYGLQAEIVGEKNPTTTVLRNLHVLRS